MSETLEAPVVPQVDVKGGAIAYVNVDGAVKAREFYRKAFAAVVAAEHPTDEQGRTMHIHLYINDGSVMIGDFYPEHGHAFEKPQAFSMTLQVKGVDAWFKRAVEAGAEVMMEPQVMFWGDRYAQVRDPFGVVWAFNEPQA